MESVVGSLWGEQPMDLGAASISQGQRMPAEEGVRVGGNERWCVPLVSSNSGVMVP